MKFYQLTIYYEIESLHNGDLSDNEDTFLVKEKIDDNHYIVLMGDEWGKLDLNEKYRWSTIKNKTYKIATKAFVKKILDDFTIIYIKKQQGILAKLFEIEKELVKEAFLK